MELREIRTFVLVAKMKSFSKAGQILYTTQPSISKIIASLEAQLGQNLFERKPRVLELTEFGRAFLPYAEEIIQAENNAMTFLSALSAKPSVFLQIGVSEPVGTAPYDNFAQKINQGVAASHMKNEQLFFTFDLKPDIELFQMLRNQKVDMVICPLLQYGDTTVSLNDLERHHLSAYSQNIVFSPDLGIAKTTNAIIQSAHGITSIDDFASIDLVSILRATYPNLSQHRMAHNWYSLLANVEANCAIGVVPDSILPLAESLGLHSIALQDEVYQMDLWVLCPKGSRYQEVVHDFSDGFKQKQNSTVN